MKPWVLFRMEGRCHWSLTGRAGAHSLDPPISICLATSLNSTCWKSDPDSHMNYIPINVPSSPPIPLHHMQDETFPQLCLKPGRWFGEAQCCPCSSSLVCLGEAVQRVCAPESLSKHSSTSLTNTNSWKQPNQCCFLEVPLPKSSTDLI